MTNKIKLILGDEVISECESSEQSLIDVTNKDSLAFELSLVRKCRIKYDNGETLEFYDKKQIDDILKAHGITK